MAQTFWTRRIALVAVAVADVCAFTVADGGRGAVGAVLGVAMVSLFFLGGRAPQAMISSLTPAFLFLLIAMGYVLRILLLLVALVHLRDASWLSRDGVGGTVVVGALAWSGFLVHQQLTSRQPTLQIAVGSSGVTP